MTNDERQTTNAKVKIVGICGSLRKDSYNKKLLKQIFKSLSAKGAEVEELIWEDFGPFNQDIEDAGMPKNVEEFKSKIEKADGIVFTTPEYNFSIPGGLKNAIDWASRPEADLDRIFGGKVVLLSGASSGVRGTARAQMHMANVCQDLGLIISPSGIMISTGGEAFDEKGNFVKDTDRQRVEKATGKFIELVKKLGG